MQRELLLTGTHGAYQSKEDPATGQFGNVRIIDAAETDQKLAVVVIKHGEGNIESRVDVISHPEWNGIKNVGIELAQKAGVDITKEPFHQFVAKAYWYLIK